MSSSDMVANPNSGSGTKVRGLVNLKKDKESKTFKNPKTWDEKLCAAFNAYGFSKFLKAHTAIPVPRDLIETTRVQQEIDLRIRKQREKHAKEEKERRIIDLTVKKEKEEDIGYQVKIPPLKPESDSPERKFEFRTPGPPPSSEKQKGLEELIRRNANEIATKEAKSQKGKEKRHARRFSIFADPYLAVREDERYLNPEASIPITIDGELKYYPLEDEEMQKERFFAWEALMGTIKEITPDTYAMVEWGNVYRLYTTIKNHLHVSSRPILVEDLNRRLDSFVKKSSESFSIFQGRWESLMTEMNEIELVIDSDTLMTKAKKAIKANHADEFRTVITTFPSLNTPSATPKQLFDALLPVMEDKENDEKEMKDRELRGGTTDKDKQKAEKKRKEKEEKERKKEEKRVKELEQQLAIALKAQQGPGKGGQEKRNPKQSDNSDIMGVCVYYQDNNCKRENCHFKHEKLSKEQRTRLDAWVSERAKLEKCSKCGKRGHSANECRSGEQGHKVRFAFERERNSRARNTSAPTPLSMQVDELREATKHFSDEQVILFAKSWADRSTQRASFPSHSEKGAGSNNAAGDSE